MSHCGIKSAGSSIQIQQKVYNLESFHSLICLIPPSSDQEQRALPDRVFSQMAARDEYIQL